MAKYNNVLVKEVKKENAFEENQERLRKRHNIGDKDVVIVEKNNMLKFFIRGGVSISRIILWIVLLSLAAIGVIALVYPEPRQAVFDVWLEAYTQFREFIG